MLNNIQIGRYCSNKSIIHSLNSITKIILLLLYCLIISFTKSFLILMLDLLLTCLYLKLSNVDMKKYIFSIKSIKWFLLIIFLFNILTTHNFLYSFEVIIKLSLVLIFSISFIFTTAIDDMIIGFNKIFSFFKIRKSLTHKITFITVFSIKFLSLLIDDINKLLEAFYIKGIIIKKINIKKRIYVYKCMIIRIIKIGLERANKYNQIIEINCYKFDYTSDNSLEIIDLLFIDLFLFVLLGVIICAI